MSIKYAVSLNKLSIYLNIYPTDYTESHIVSIALFNFVTINNETFRYSVVYLKMLLHHISNYVCSTTYVVQLK